MNQSIVHGWCISWARSAASAATEVASWESRWKIGLSTKQSQAVREFQPWHSRKFRIQVSRSSKIANCLLTRLPRGLSRGSPTHVFALARLL